jgi:hypothetical protein
VTDIAGFVKGQRLGLGAGASPSVATGVPQTAITASPMNFSTTPPYRPTTVRATSK